MKVSDRTFSDSIQGTHYQTATLEVLNRIGDALEKLLPLAERIAVALEGPEDEQSLPEEWGWGETEDETTDDPPDNYDPMTNRKPGDTRPYLD